MAKRKARELKEQENGAGKSLVLSSGVEVVVLPFPAGLWERINAKAFSDFPDPEPPKKTIEVVDGTEEIDDLEDPAYKEKLREADENRNSFLGEAIVDMCIQVKDMEKWESKIKRIEKYSDPFPTEKEDRRYEFLTRFALRTKGDYEIVMVEAVAQMMISNPEVAERIAFFQREVARTISSDSDASGIND